MNSKLYWDGKAVKKIKNKGEKMSREEGREEDTNPRPILGKFQGHKIRPQVYFEIQLTAL